MPSAHGPPRSSDDPGRAFSLRLPTILIGMQGRVFAIATPIPTRAAERFCFWLGLVAGIGLFALRLTSEQAWWTGHLSFAPLPRALMPAAVDCDRSAPSTPQLLRGMAPRGVSADGSLAYEQPLGETAGEKRHDCVAPAAGLIDAATREVVVDASRWPASWIKPQAGGSLVLKLRHNECDALFRIDPVARTFRNKGDGWPERPLHELAEAVEEARRAVITRPVDVCTSPDDSIKVELAAAEWGATHWVRSPCVTDLSSQHVVLDLGGGDWDASLAFPAERVVQLALRRYTHAGHVAVEFDLARGTYRILSETGQMAASSEAPLAAVAAGLKASSRRANAAARKSGARPQGQGCGLLSGASWRSILPTLVAAAVLIAAASAASWMLQPHHGQRLVQAPTMSGAEMSRSDPAIRR